MRSNVDRCPDNHGLALISAEQQLRCLLAVSLCATLGPMLSRSKWTIEEINGLRSYYLSEVGLETGREGLVQGVFTRRGGVSQGPFESLNVGSTVGDDHRAVQTNHGLICEFLRIPPEAITTGCQVHGTHVHRVRSEDRGALCPATDGLITDVSGIALMLRFADCVPLLFFDSQHHAVGLAHAGWRGTLGRIAAATVRAMQRAYSSVPEELLVGIGPSIGPCCYEIGTDLADRVQAQFPDYPELVQWRRVDERSEPQLTPYFNLWLANRLQLEAAGVHSIYSLNRCTACHQDEFYSYRSASTARRDSPGGATGQLAQTGRFAAVLGLRAL
jgi:YfiH family protein